MKDRFQTLCYNGKNGGVFMKYYVEMTITNNLGSIKNYSTNLHGDFASKEDAEKNAMGNIHNFYKNGGVLKMRDGQIVVIDKANIVELVFQVVEDK